MVNVEALSKPEAGRKVKDLRLDILSVVLSRAVIFAVLFFVALKFGQHSMLRGMVIIYGMATILYLATWIWSYRSSQASPVGFLLYFQFFVEIIVEAAIFLSGGGYASDYGLLFILTILTSGLFFQYAGSLVTATLATGFFFYAGYLHLGGLIPPGLEFVGLSMESVQIQFFLSTTLFYLVATLSSHLSRRLLITARELEGTHKALDIYQFSAENMMNNLPTGLMFFDADGSLTYHNRLCENFLGFPLEKGMQAGHIFPGPLNPSLASGETLVLEEGLDASEIELDMGNCHPLHIQIKSLAREGKLMGFIFTLMDFTKLKKMEVALLRSERMAALGEMSAKIAHEIRNPLACISGSAQLLHEVQLENADDKKLLSLIVNESTRLDRILANLLDYARDRKPVFRHVSVLSLFQKVRTTLQKTLEFNKGVVIIRQIIENEDIQISSDKDILCQILLNLGLNGLQALPENGGYLDFLARKHDKCVFLEVVDNGCGMSQNEISRAFEPFFTTKINGTGLGLATSFHYVQSLDGKILLDSSKGTGTRITIIIPEK